MKLYIQSFDAEWDVNPMVRDGILNHLPLTDAMGLADAVIVVVCYKANYRFNVALQGINKPVILMDFTEFGWDAGTNKNVLGGGGYFTQFGHLNSDEWKKLDRWAQDHPVILHFKRELFHKDRTPRLIPIEFPCVIPARPVQSKGEFDARSIEVFNCWGLSHPARQWLHGDIFRNAHAKGINVIDAWSHRIEGRAWASIHTPHYDRRQIGEVMDWNHRAKISVSLPGAGVKCFRSAEAPVGSIMAMWRDELAWSIPWIHCRDCITLTPGCEFEELQVASKLHGLYDIYRNGQETIDSYRSTRYVREYVKPAIESAL